MRERRNWCADAVVLAAFLGVSSLLGQQESVSGRLTTIHAFNGIPDGVSPDGGLIMDGNGALYGLTYRGGSAGKGSVFQLVPPSAGGRSWTENILYSFSGGTDGEYPFAGLVLDSSGNLYGTTENGGTVNGACASGCGVVFELSPPTSMGGAWTQSVLYAFAGGRDGGVPSGSLVFDRAGNLYGTAATGGASNHGAVFQLGPVTGTPSYAVLHSFAGGSDGADPAAGLVISATGKLYGTTYSGGTSNAGTVFELAHVKAKWHETVLYSFSGGADGGFPGARVTLARQGVLYGTAEVGGVANNGTVFQLTPPAAAGDPWTYNVVYSFTGPDGANSYGDLAIARNGTIYGTTLLGGLEGYGTVFSLTPPQVAGDPWNESVLHSFNFSPDGANPVASVFLGPANKAYGTAGNGGKPGAGTVFELTY